MNLDQRLSGEAPPGHLFSLKYNVFSRRPWSRECQCWSQANLSSHPGLTFATWLWMSKSQFPHLQNGANGNMLGDGREDQ